jgi:hypothetical protein
MKFIRTLFALAALALVPALYGCKHMTNVSGPANRLAASVNTAADLNDRTVDSLDDARQLLDAAKPQVKLVKQKVDSAFATARETQKTLTTAKSQAVEVVDHAAKAEKRINKLESDFFSVRQKRLFFGMILLALVGVTLHILISRGILAGTIWTIVAHGLTAIGSFGLSLAHSLWAFVKFRKTQKTQ